MNKLNYQGTNPGNYDPAVKRIIAHARENNLTELVVHSYQADKENDPIGYNPLFELCNVNPLEKESLQQSTTDDTYDVFVNCCMHGGTKDLEKYRRYNNALYISQNRVSY